MSREPRGGGEFGGIAGGSNVLRRVLDGLEKVKRSATATWRYAQHTRTGGNPSQFPTTGPDGIATVMVRPQETTHVFIVPVSGSFATADLDGSSADEPIAAPMPPGVARIQIHVATDEGKPMPSVRFIFRYNGQPVPQLVADTLSNQQRLSFITNTAGVMTLDAMPQGTYEFWPVVDQRVVSAPALSGAAPVTIVAAAGTNTAEVTLKPVQPGSGRR
jgi:hypothetical protein